MNLYDSNLRSKAFLSTTITKTSSGTATIISIYGDNVALLTAAHIVSYPDTIISYYAANGKNLSLLIPFFIKNGKKYTPIYQKVAD